MALKILRLRKIIQNQSEMLSKLTASNKRTQNIPKPSVHPIIPSSASTTVSSSNTASSKFQSASKQIPLEEKGEVKGLPRRSKGDSSTTRIRIRPSSASSIGRRNSANIFPASMKKDLSAFVKKSQQVWTPSFFPLIFLTFFFLSLSLPFPFSVFYLYSFLNLLFPLYSNLISPL